ncbi:MAG: VRR-NUC domain-containing protein, partial [Microbacteriaceae bacterium]
AGAAGGHPDVIGWRGERVIAIESKSPGDQLKPSQIEWFTRAMEFGLRPEDIGVVEWRALASREAARSERCRGAGSRASQRDPGPGGLRRPAVAGSIRALTTQESLIGYR